ncbi:MAG TPA: glycosyltransferase, partial [Candidatus Nanoarchaeia archaeon]|nr:glycosyltransferase [Candidatus Nanoarchaeia archaeon]
MVKNINRQAAGHIVFYALFGLISTILMGYYLSNTVIHFTTPQQFPINSFQRFPLSFLIFPAEVFSFLFTLYFIYNMINGNIKSKTPNPFPNKKETSVAVLIPVYNEPKEIVANTLSACRKLRWEGGTKIYLLDDSTKEKDMQNMNFLSKKFGCSLVRRKDRIGYKAGNINNALREKIQEEFFVILDSDQAPEPEFLEETMDFFTDSNVAFVQTPQHFVNTGTPLERASKLGTSIFYYSQCVSKAKDGALPFCGTNAVMRTSAFKKVSGFSYYTATEDIELGLRLN